MVRRHGKRTTLVCEEKKKRERGECSTEMDQLGLNAPKRKRGEWQGLGHMHQFHSPFIFDFKWAVLN
jgi:hypothetical protein